MPTLRPGRPHAQEGRVTKITAGDSAEPGRTAAVLLGAFLCFAAAVGLVRFPDVLSRMHAATKPQTLGLILFAVGVELSLRSWAAFGAVY